MLFLNDYKTDRVVISRPKSALCYIRKRRICDTKSYPFFVVFSYVVYYVGNDSHSTTIHPPPRTSHDSRPTTLADHRYKYVVGRIYMYYYITYIHFYYYLRAFLFFCNTHTRSSSSLYTPATWREWSPPSTLTTAKCCKTAHDFILFYRRDVLKNIFIFYFMDSPPSSLTYYYY